MSLDQSGNRPDTGAPFWCSWSIRTRLLLLVLMSVLPALAIILHTGFEDEKNDVENAKKNVLSTVEHLANRQEIVTAGIQQTLMTIAQYPGVQNGDGHACTTLFQSLHKHSPYNCEFIAVRQDGTALIARKDDTPFSVDDRSYFQKALETRNFVVGEYVVSRFSDIPVLPYAVPVIDDQNQVSGVVIATVNLEQYQNLLHQMGFPEGSVVGLEDRNGRRLYRFPKLDGMTNEEISQSLPEKTWQYISGPFEKGTYTEKGIDGVRRIYGFIQLRLPENEQPYLYIRVGIPEESALASATRKLYNNLILLSIACSLALAAAWFLGNLTLVDPIKHLVDVSKQLGAGNLKARSRLSYKKRGEIGELAQSLDIMAFHLEKREIERFESHKAISELSKQNQLILDAAGEGIVGLNAQGSVVFMNPAAALMTGHNAKELLGQDLHGTIHHSLPDGSPYPPDSCPMYKTLSMGVACRVEDEILWRKDGTSFPCSYSSMPIVDDERISGAVIIFRDISERKKAETILRNSEEHFRLLIENITDVITVLDDRGILRYASPSLERVLGFKPSELVNKNGCEFIHREDLNNAVDEFGRSFIAPGVCFSVQMRCRHKDGSWRIFETIGKSFLDRKEQLATVVNLHDITGRKQAENEKDKMEVQFRQSQKMESVGRLAGGVAHDFNNMLSVIIGHAGMVLYQLAQTDPLRHNLIEITKAASRSADLTRQLLAFARKQTITPKILDLNEAVSDILKMLNRLIGEQIEVAWIPGYNLWPVKIDPTQIDQILVNLTVNARDAITGSGSITIATSNEFLDESFCQTHPYFSPGAFVLLTVTDTGEGMDKATLAHIFEPFFTTKELGKGTGLGLATVYGAVKQNNGFIEVKSEPGQGATFQIYLPRTSSPIQEKTREISRKNHWGTETVLLVEDEKSILDLTQGILECYGYTVLAASNPDIALTLAKNHPGKIDLLVTDVVMPKLSGMELNKALKLIKPGYKCLFWSGYISIEDACSEVLEEGIHFLQKPFSPETLIEKIEHVLASP